MFRSHYLPVLTSEVIINYCCEMGIGVAVTQLTLDQQPQVRLLYPQPLQSPLVVQIIKYVVAYTHRAIDIKRVFTVCDIQ